MGGQSLLNFREGGGGGGGGGRLTKISATGMYMLLPQGDEITVTLNYTSGMIIKCVPTLMSRFINFTLFKFSILRKNENKLSNSH